MRIFLFWQFLSTAQSTSALGAALYHFYTPKNYNYMARSVSVRPYLSICLSFISYFLRERFSRLPHLTECRPFSLCDSSRCRSFCSNHCPCSFRRHSPATNELRTITTRITVTKIIMPTLTASSNRQRGAATQKVTMTYDITTYIEECYVLSVCLRPAYRVPFDTLHCG